MTGAPVQPTMAMKHSLVRFNAICVAPSICICSVKAFTFIDLKERLRTTDFNKVLRVSVFYLHSALCCGQVLEVLVWCCIGAVLSHTNTVLCMFGAFVTITSCFPFVQEIAGAFSSCAPLRSELSLQRGADATYYLETPKALHCH